MDQDHPRPRQATARRRQIRGQLSARGRDLQIGHRVYPESSPAGASIAYISGTLGTLIGADLLNLRRLRNLGARMASIGGAGTFDGVFLSGIIAVLLVAAR